MVKYKSISVLFGIASLAVVSGLYAIEVLARYDLMEIRSHYHRMYEDYSSLSAESRILLLIGFLS